MLSQLLVLGKKDKQRKGKKWENKLTNNLYLFPIPGCGYKLSSHFKFLNYAFPTMVVPTQKLLAKIIPLS